MNDLQSVVESALADFARATTPAELEDAKARFLGKNGVVTAQLKSLGALSPEDKKARGRRDQRGEAVDRRRPRRASIGDGRGAARAAARSAVARRHAARPHARPRRSASREPRARAHRIDLRVARLRSRRRPRDRDRLVQLHGAEQSRESSCALDAGHVLRRCERRRRPPAQPAPAHLADADPARAGPCEEARRRRDDARRARDRARPHVSRRQRRDARADVPSGRRPLARRGRELPRPQGGVSRLHAGLLRDQRADAALSPQLFPRSPSRAPRST